MGCGDSHSVNLSHQSHPSQNGHNHHNHHHQPHQKQTSNKAEETVAKYKQLAASIRTIEDANVVKIYQLKKEELSKLEAEINSLISKEKEAAAVLQKEKADVDKLQSVAYYFKEQNYNAELMKEQEEYMQALNRFEMVQFEVNTAKQRHAAQKQELVTYQKKIDELEKLYKAQDQLLDKLFHGKYGSELENQLESQVDKLVEWKQRVGLAHSKWVNARGMVKYAVDKISFAIQKFQEVGRFAQFDMAPKYACATDARNSLIEAIQVIAAANSVLPKITFPYCTNSEMATFSVALGAIYGDIQDMQRYNRALALYGNFQQSANNLLQWMDHVIKNTIAKDYDEANLSLGKATSSLYAERIRLIGGSPVATKDSELPPPAAPTEPNKSQENSPKREAAKDLPPPPSQEEIFGDIENLKKEHEKALAEFEKAQETNKERMDQTLQEKLEARRTRRARQQQQQQMA